MPKVIVFHAYLSCDTGCCGHIVEIDGNQVGRMEFCGFIARTPEAIRQFVIDIVTAKAGTEHVKDIDWDNCIISHD